MEYRPGRGNNYHGIIPPPDPLNSSFKRFVNVDFPGTGSPAIPIITVFHVFLRIYEIDVFITADRVLLMASDLLQTLFHSTYLT